MMWRLGLALLTLLTAGCGGGPASHPQSARQRLAPPAPPQMDLDRLIVWLDRSPIHYDLQGEASPVGGFEAFFRSGFPAVQVPLDRRALLRQLGERRPGVDQQTALEDSVLVDARGGEAWQAYLAFLAREGRGLPPAPLLPPGDVQLTAGGARIVYPEGRTVWAFYLACKAAARLEPGFRRLLGAPEEEPYRWTLAEERACLQIFAQAARRAAREGHPPKGLAAHILAAATAGVLEGYAVVEGLGALAPGVLTALPPGARRAGRAYLRWAARPVDHLPPPLPLLAGEPLAPQPLPRDARLRLEAAITALDLGSVHRARAVLSELARRHPRHARVHRALAQALLRNGDAVEAAAAAEQAEQLAPGDPSTWALMARARLRAGDAAGAKSAADRLRWLWWLGRDPAIMRAPVLFWGSAAGGAVLERLDHPEGGGARFWWIRPQGPEGATRRPLTANTPADALIEAGYANRPQ